MDGLLDGVEFFGYFLLKPISTATTIHSLHVCDETLGGTSTYDLSEPQFS